MSVILVRSNISHSHFRPQTDTNSSYTIIKTDQRDILICTFYRHPRVKLLPLMELQNILLLYISTIILANANLHHQNFGHSIADDLGKQFRKFTLRNNLNFLGPNFNTFHFSISKGKPDIILCNDLFTKFAIHITPGQRLSASDHILTRVQINSNPILFLTNPKLNFIKAV